MFIALLESFAPQPVIMRTLTWAGTSLYPITRCGRKIRSWAGAGSASLWIGLRSSCSYGPCARECRPEQPAHHVSHDQSVDEIKAARQALERAQRELSEKGQQCVVPPVGAMVEVPSAVFVLSALARYVEFFLSQTTLPGVFARRRPNNPNVASHMKVSTRPCCGPCVRS